MDRNEQPRQSENTGPTESRRSYLQKLGAAGLVTGLAGASVASAESAGASTDPSAPGGVTVTDADASLVENVSQLELGSGLSGIERGDSVRIDAAQSNVATHANPEIVHVQEDLGVQPEQDDVWGAIYDHYSSFVPAQRCHKYVIPCGTWYVETDSLPLDGHEYFGVVGDPHAVLRVNDQNVNLLMRVGNASSSPPHAHRTEMKNLQIDIRGDHDAGIGRWYTQRYGHIENIEIRGRRARRDPNYGGDRHTLMVCAIRPEASNAIKNVRFPQGDKRFPGESGVGHAIPFSAEPPHVGTNIWERCHVTGFKDNGFYLSNNDGCNLIVSCVARNNSGANIRLGSNDVVLNSMVMMDRAPNHPWTGLWLENGDGQMVKGLRIYNSIQKNTEIVRCTQNGPATLSNMHINDTGSGNRTIRVSTDGTGNTIFEKCSITDRTNPSTSDYGIYVRSSRVTFEDCQFDFESQSNADRHGIIVHTPSDPANQLTISDCEIEADGAVLRFAQNGWDHNVDKTIFRGDVLSDSGTTLSNVFWTGNRHYGTTSFSGSRSNWRGGSNWGFNV